MGMRCLTRCFFYFDGHESESQQIECGLGGGRGRGEWIDGEFYFKLLRADWMSVSQPL